ncbi:MAG: hypothetical protein AAGA38_06685 [Pseudomonadota bacterium]
MSQDLSLLRLYELLELIEARASFELHRKAMQTLLHKRAAEAKKVVLEPHRGSFVDGMSLLQGVQVQSAKIDEKKRNAVKAHTLRKEEALAAGHWRESVVRRNVVQRLRFQQREKIWKLDRERSEHHALTTQIWSCRTKSVINTP